MDAASSHSPGTGLRLLWFIEAEDPGLISVDLGGMETLSAEVSTLTGVACW